MVGILKTYNFLYIDDNRFQIPNYKSQAPNKFQIPILNDQKYFIFLIGIYLLFGLPARSRFGEGRCLEFGAYPTGVSWFRRVGFFPKVFSFLLR